jgi:hypothetical protein
MMTVKLADELCYFAKLPQIRTRARNAEHAATLADTLIQEMIFPQVGEGKRTSKKGTRPKGPAVAHSYT